MLTGVNAVRLQLTGMEMMFKDQVIFMETTCSANCCCDSYRLSDGSLGTETDIELKDVVTYLRPPPPPPPPSCATVDYFSEVFNHVKILVVVPATNAVSERSASALRRLKVYLHTTMSQERLNHCMILLINKEITDKLNMTDIGNQFASALNDWQNRFEKICNR